MNSVVEISIIIPTFNRAKFLYSSLICLINQQTEVTYEILIIDSGNDDTQIVVEHFQKCFSNIFYKKISNTKNISLLRNTGVEIARGNILIFLDNDLLTPPDFIKKHFEKNIQKDNLVVLGYRNSLTQFDLKINGEIFLKNSFSLLNTLPFVEDPRKDKNISFHGWRFLYGHSFSLKKTLFNCIGGFDVEFGDAWGYEDIELGYRLYLAGAEFYFLKDSPSFHQPHISNCDNVSIKKNISLFVRKHNSFLVELACSYGFEDFEEILSKWENVTVSSSNEYQLILGIVNGSKEKASEDKRLGILIPFDNKTKEKILIKKNILEYPIEIALQILIESERVGKRLFIEKLSDTEFQKLKILYNRIGYQIDEIKLENDDEVLLEKKASTICSIILPKIFDVEKRFVYKWIALALEKYHVVQVFDLLNFSNFNNEDFNLLNEENISLDKMFQPYYGKSGKIIISEDMLKNINIEAYNDTPTIIDDLGFPAKNKILNNKGNSNFIDQADFSFLTFAAASTYVNYFKELVQNQETAINDNLLCFMENGFYEDGIDTILDVFSKIKNNESKLIIKTPDYDIFFNKSYHLYNEEAVKLQFLHQQQKYIKDKYYLYSKIEELKLAGSITIIKANYAFKEILELISNSKTIIWNSKGVYVSPEIYAAIILGKTVIMSSHHIIPPELKKNTLTCKSKESFLSRELSLPNTLDLLNHQAYSIDLISLLDNMQKECDKKIEKDIVYNLNKDAEKIIEKCATIFPLNIDSLSQPKAQDRQSRQYLGIT